MADQRDGGAFRRFVLGVLAAVLPSDWAEDIVRDLEEAHARRRSARGPLRAGLWLTAQAVLFATRFAAAGAARAVRGAGAGELLPTLRRDVGYALRTMRRSPRFHTGILLIVAVGIGANTAIFSVVRAVVLAPLPHPRAEDLVVLDPNPWIPTEVLRGLAGSGGALDALEGTYPRRFTVTGGPAPLELAGAEVTPGFLRLLGAGTALGRSFVDADADPDAPPTAILSWDTWRGALGGAPDVLGRTVRVDGVPREIVGVTEPGFRPLTPRMDGDPGIFIPGRMDRLGLAVLPEGSPSWTVPLARLAEDAPARRARSTLDAAVARYREGQPDARGNPRWDLRWTRLHTWLTRDARPALLVLQAAVGLVLLLACVNVANLLLVRAGSRRSEIAVRTALGAPGSRILVQQLTGTVVLFVLGGVAGVLVVGVGLDPLLTLAPRELPRLSDVSLDGPTLLFALGTALLTGVVFGVLPAAATARTAPARILREAGPTAAGSSGRHRLSQGLVVAEIGLTVILVAGAGVLARSFASLTAQPLGFRTLDVLAVPLHVPEHRYETVPRLEDYYRRLVERMAREPGVEAVAVSNNLPLERGASRRLYVVEGETEPREAQYGVVSPDYFRVLDIPLLRGRAIDEGDRRGTPGVAVIDQVMRQEVWPGVDPLGRRFRFVDEEEWITVVGVSGAVRGSGLDRDPGPGFHISYRQRPATPVELGVGREAVLLVRGRGPAAEGLPGSLREAVQDVDPLQPVPRVTPLERLVSAGVAPQRFRTVLLGSFAVLALLLAVTGVAGVVGHVMAERTHEFGVRRAMGATDRDVVASVLRWGLRRTAAGVALGLMGVAVLGPWLSSLLFGVTATDPPTLVAAVLVVLLTTLGACLIPALRAMRVDAVVALRRR